MLTAVKFKLGSLEDLSAMEEAGARIFDYDIKMQRAKEFLTDSRHHIVFAYYEDKIIGMASGVHYVHPDKDPQLFINEVSVQKEFRTNGIGRELVKRLCEHGKELKCTEAWLGVDSSNVSARKAYAEAKGSEDPFLMVSFKY